MAGVSIDVVIVLLSIARRLSSAPLRRTKVQIDYVISYFCNACRSAKREAISSWTGTTLTTLLTHEMTNQGVTAILTVVSNVFSVKDAIRTTTIKMLTTTRWPHWLPRPALHLPSAEAPDHTSSTTTNTMSSIIHIMTTSNTSTTSNFPLAMILYLGAPAVCLCGAVIWIFRSAHCQDCSKRRKKKHNCHLGEVPTLPPELEGQVANGIRVTPYGGFTNTLPQGDGAHMVHAVASGGRDWQFCAPRAQNAAKVEQEALPVTQIYVRPVADPCVRSGSIQSQALRIAANPVPHPVSDVAGKHKYHIEVSQTDEVIASTASTPSICSIPRVGNSQADCQQEWWAWIDQDVLQSTAVACSSPSRPLRRSPSLLQGPRPSAAFFHGQS